MTYAFTVFSVFNRCSSSFSLNRRSKIGSIKVLRGFLKQLKDSVIQKKIKESAEKEQEKFDNGELVLIGTNKYQNTADKMQQEIQLYPFLKKNPRKTLIEPILERRLSEKLEEQRLKTEKTVNA